MYILYFHLFAKLHFEESAETFWPIYASWFSICPSWICNWTVPDSCNYVAINAATIGAYCICILIDDVESFRKTN